LRVAAVQYRAKANPHESFTGLMKLAADAAKGADLVVLPELASSPYALGGVREARRFAEPVHGPTALALGRYASTYGTWIVCGIVEEDNGRLFNSALVINPRGRVEACYRKTLLFELDWRWASPGNSGYMRFDTDQGAFTVGICMDLNDERFTRWVKGADIDVIAFPTNWLAEGAELWSYWQGRIAQTGASLVAANSWGRERGVEFAGRSVILQEGSPMSSAPATGDTWIAGRVRGLVRS